MAEVTPWEVTGNVDYEKLMKEFGAEPLTKDLVNQLPEPIYLPLRRGYFYAHRGFDEYVDAFKKGERISVVTGRGPSGRMHLGHILPFYTVKWFQERMNADVIIPISDDEKYSVKRGLKVSDVEKYRIDNLVDILAVGFDPEKTRIVVDFLDTEIYKPSVIVGKRVTYSTVKALFGLKGEENISWVFYPAVQMVHLFLPQIVWGNHMTVVPVAIDQDPYIRVARDIAHKLGLLKPSALLSKFMPSLESPHGKMSTSGGGEEKVIWLTDDEETIRRKIMKYAFSGGRPTIEEHRRLGGIPEIDVSFLYLLYFFEEDDKKIREVEEKYRSGEMLTGELKEYASKKIAEFLKEHQKRREKVINSGVENEIEKYRLREDERERIKTWGRDL